MAHKVLICRQPNGKTSEIEISLIRKVHWSKQSGGYRKNYSSDKLYGYIPYSLAMELVDCSGEHDYGRNSAKVMICKPNPKEDPEDEKYVEGYNLLEPLAGEKPTTKILENRPEGGIPCTRQILAILDEGPMERKELRDRILHMGYEAITFRGAIWRMAHDGRIHCIGSPTSPKQILYKTTCD